MKIFFSVGKKVLSGVNINSNNPKKMFNIYFESNFFKKRLFLSNIILFLLFLKFWLKWNFKKNLKFKI